MAVEVLALGLLTAKKWDRATDGQPDSYVPDPDSLALKDNFTASEIGDIRSTAAEMLFDLAPSGWTEWWWGVAGGIVSSLVWAVVLIGIGMIAIHQSGGDLGDAMRGLMGVTKAP